MGYRCLMCGLIVQREDNHGYTLCNKKACLDEFLERFSKTRLGEHVVTAKDAWLYFVPFDHEGSCVSVRLHHVPNKDGTGLRIPCWADADEPKKCPACDPRVPREYRAIERARMKAVCYHNYAYPKVQVLEVSSKVAGLIADVMCANQKRQKAVAMLRAGQGIHTAYNVMAIDRPAYMKDRRFPWDALKAEADAIDLRADVHVRNPLLEEIAKRAIKKALEK